MKTKIIILTLLLSVLLTGVSHAQIYSNNEGELICISADTVFFKLMNRDGLKTFGIGKALITRRKFKFRLKEMFPLIQLTSILEVEKANDNGINVTVLDYDETPLAYCIIKIKKSGERKPYFQGYCNKEGTLTLKQEDVEALKNLEVEILIEHVGFSTLEKLVLQPGNNYTMSAFLNYSFTLIDKRRNLHFESLDSNRLQVKYNNYNRILELQNETSKICNPIIGK